METFFHKMTELTIEDFKEEFKGEKFAVLLNELNSDPSCFDRWKGRPKAQWRESHGDAGIRIYHFLRQEDERGNI